MDWCSDAKIVEEGDWQWEALKVIEDLREDAGYTSVGITVGGNIMIWSGALSVGIVVDGSGNVAFINGYAYNIGSPELGIIAGAYTQTVPTASSYEIAGGESTQTGGTISGEILSLPVSIGNETNIITDTETRKELYGNTTTVSLGVSLSPGEMHAGASYAEVDYLFNYLDTLEDAIWSTVPET